SPFSVSVFSRPLPTGAACWRRAGSISTSRRTWRRCPASRSFSPCWASTCWATGCAMRWTRACAEVTMAETPDPETAPRFETVLQRYGARLTGEQLDDLRKIVRGQVDAARALRAVRLTNGDEPFQPFDAYRAESR